MGSGDEAERLDNEEESKNAGGEEGFEGDVFN